jgi:hypothetical protein
MLCIDKGGMQISAKMSARLSSLLGKPHSILLYGAIESPDVLQQRVSREVQLKSCLCLAATRLPCRDDFEELLARTPRLTA